MSLHRLSLLGLLACACAQRPIVRPGIEVLLSDSAHLIAGKRLALLTNQTGVDRSGRRDVDALTTHDARLSILLSPEHGLAGTEDREGLPDAVDSATGLPIYSMYGGTPLPQIRALDSVDVILIDLQDIGARYYSYPPTAVLLMIEAQRRGKRVVVLDRPNPVGGTLVQGNLREGWTRVTRVADFLALPMRHGMSLGEILSLANELLGIGADLVVVPAAGWRRETYYDGTGLPWVKPSPNMPDLESAIHYPGTCLFEGTNLSVGRGTPFAFQVVGAPWLDAPAVLKHLSLSGVAATAIEFTPVAPTDGKFGGIELQGIRLKVTDRARYDPTHSATALLAAIQATHPDSLKFAPRFDVLAAGPELREAIVAGRPLAPLWARWDSTLTRFQATRAKYLRY
jgi:uncharacterized protein YbbC (DUF1343 family)